MTIPGLPMAFAAEIHPEFIRSARRRKVNLFIVTRLIFDL
jgi:hypothetical protein